MSGSRIPRVCVVVALSLELLACSSDRRAADPPPGPDNVPPPVGDTAPEPLDPPTEEPQGQGGGKPASDDTASQPKPSGRPMVLMGPKTEISSTFGATPGAVLKLKAESGEIILKIPEFALSTGINITWKIASERVATQHPVIGSIAQIITTPGNKPKAQAYASQGPKYELRLPLGSNETVNVAVGTAEIGDNNTPGKISWTVMAPNSADTSFKIAYFYLDAIGPIQYFHATSAPAP